MPSGGGRTATAPHTSSSSAPSAPVAQVWAAVTEPDRLGRWIGTWAGDPASGTVQFRMTAEGEDIEAEPMTVHECDPPRRLVLSWDSAGTLWHVELDLIVPEAIKDTDAWRTLPWYAHFDAAAQRAVAQNRTLLITVRPRSFVLLFPRARYL